MSISKGRPLYSDEYCSVLIVNQQLMYTLITCSMDIAREVYSYRCKLNDTVKSGVVPLTVENKKILADLDSLMIKMIESDEEGRALSYDALKKSPVSEFVEPLQTGFTIIDVCESSSAQKYAVDLLDNCTNVATLLQDLASYRDTYPDDYAVLSNYYEKCEIMGELYMNYQKLVDEFVTLRMMNKAAAHILKND